jgi:hypothetical protein
VVRQRIWDGSQCQARCVNWTPGGTYSGMARDAKPESVPAAHTQHRPDALRENPRPNQQPKRSVDNMLRNCKHGSFRLIWEYEQAHQGGADENGNDPSNK